jgi:hypothetical protein
LEMLWMLDRHQGPAACPFATRSSLCRIQPFVTSYEIFSGYSLLRL